MKSIHGRIVETDILVAEIASAADDQSKGIEQINTAIVQLDQVTQANAASSHQSAATAEELREQTNALNTVVDALVKLVGSKIAESEGNMKPALNKSAELPHKTAETQESFV